MANIYMQFDQYDCIIIWECYSFSVVTDHMLSLHETYIQADGFECMAATYIKYSKVFRFCFAVSCKTSMYPTKVCPVLSAHARTL